MQDAVDIAASGREQSSREGSEHQATASARNPVMHTESSNTSPKHERWIDVVRAISCIGVVFLHVSSGFPEGNMVPYIGAERSFAWAALRIVIGRSAVPCFFMLTGYLLLDNARPLTAAKLGKHMARVAALLVCFGLPMNIVEQVVNNTPILDIIPRSVVLLMSGKSWGAMWYLYALLFVYLLTPLMRLALDRLSRKQNLAVLAGLFVLGCMAWPIFYIAHYGNKIPSLDFPPAPFYVFLGGWLHRYMNDKSQWRRFGSRLLIAAGIALSLLFFIEADFIPKQGWINFWVESYANPFIAIYTLAVFELVRFEVPSPSEDGGVGRLVSLLSRDSLGIYLTHTVFFNFMYKFAHISPLYTPPGSYVLFWIAGIVFGLLATEALRHLPVYRELV